MTFDHIGAFSCLYVVSSVTGLTLTQQVLSSRWIVGHPLLQCRLVCALSGVIQAFGPIRVVVAGYQSLSLVLKRLAHIDNTREGSSISFLCLLASFSRCKLPLGLRIIARLLLLLLALVVIIAALLDGELGSLVLGTLWQICMALAHHDRRRIRMASLDTSLCSAISRLWASLLISLHVSVSSTSIRCCLIILIVYGNLLILMGVYLLLHFLTAICSSTDVTSCNELIILLLILLSLCRIVSFVCLLF